MPRSSKLTVTDRALAGGISAKLLALRDALGNRAKLALMPGQRHDSLGARRAD